MLVLASLANLIDYPTRELAAHVADCIDRMEEQKTGTGERLSQFKLWVTSLPQARIEEIYTGTFETPARCTPYAGHQLLGPGNRRGRFLAELRAHYRNHGFHAGNELPDYLPVLLRFLGHATDSPERRELIEYCVLPAIIKMLAELEPTHPYRAPLETAAWLLEGGRAGGSF